MRAGLSHKRVRPDRDAFEVSRSRLAELLERISFKGAKLLFGYLRQVSGVKARSHRIVAARLTPSAENSNVAGCPPCAGSSTVMRACWLSATIDAIFAVLPKIACTRPIAPASAAGCRQSILGRRDSGNMTRVMAPFASAMIVVTSPVGSVTSTVQIRTGPAG